MRLWSLVRGDIRFQYKYGIYFLYLIFTIMYICLIFSFPETWREKAAILMIFTDPAAMGLYFMGAMVLFEKSERVLNSIAISPVRPYEYMMSKLLSIGVISVIVGLAIGLFSNTIYFSLYFILGIFLCSCLFSAVGMIFAARSISLNSFMLSTIPAQLLINIPAIAWLFGFRPGWMIFHPGVCMMEISLNGKYTIIALIFLGFWVLIVSVLANKMVKSMFKVIGGIKL